MQGLRFSRKSLAGAIFTVSARAFAKVPRSFRGLCTRSEVAGAPEKREARRKARILGWFETRDVGCVWGRRVFFSFLRFCVSRMFRRHAGGEGGERKRKKDGKTKA